MPPSWTPSSPAWSVLVTWLRRRTARRGREDRLRRQHPAPAPRRRRRGAGAGCWRRKRSSRPRRAVLLRNHVTSTLQAGEEGVQLGGIALSQPQSAELGEHQGRRQSRDERLLIS